MMPHGRKDAKFDSKSKLYELNELAELYNCNNVVFFEARKGKDLYVWVSKVPNGPTVKLHLQNRKWPMFTCSPRVLPRLVWLTKTTLIPLLLVHTMEELHFTGNCLKGSRPILSFDAAFERDPYLQVIKELFTHAFGVPPGARKSKPFVDHVLSFSIADGKIWVRNYQISEVEPSAKDGANAEADEEASAAKAPKKKRKQANGEAGLETDISLVEIGPRFVLTPIVIQEGSFGGPIIYENKQFVSPNQVRADVRRSKALRHNTRAEALLERRTKRANLGLVAEKRGKRDELDTRELFA